MQCRIDMAINGLERPNPARLGIIRKRIEHGARHMIVDPVDRPGIARTRIGFQIVNAHAARRPLPYANMSIVDPDVASPLRRRCQVDGDDERSFRRNGRGPLRQTYVGHQMRDGDVWFQRRSNHKARCMREPEVLGHLLAVRWSSAHRSSRHVVCLKFGIRFANEHAAWTAMARPTPKLLYPCLLSCRCSAGNPAYAESSAYAEWGAVPPGPSARSRSEEL